MKIKFYLPDFYYFYKLNTTLIALLKGYPEYFYDNIEIGAVYGSFPGAIWNGGRLMSGITDQNNIQATIKTFNDLDIPIRYTFTNCLLEEKHIYDTYCNLCMEQANNGMNEILVNSPILEEYLRKEYPNFKYILSTTKNIRDVNQINNLSNNYYLIVTDYRDNNNDDYLNKIIQKDKIELLINEYCFPNCHQRQQHYEEYAKAQLGFTDFPSSFKCLNEVNNFFEILKFPTVIKVDDLYNKYIEMGFSHFKIVGRSSYILYVIESYVYYLVKSEYKDLVRHELIRFGYN